MQDSIAAISPRHNSVIPFLIMGRYRQLEGKRQCFFPILNHQGIHLFPVPILTGMVVNVEKRPLIKSGKFGIASGLVC